MIQAILTPLFVALTCIYAGWLILFLFPWKAKKTFDAYPAISIVIPAHDEEKYIEETVASVLAADYPADREVLVIDDGSADDTPDIIARLAARDARVTPLSTGHVGKSNAINHAVDHTAHDVVVVLDADTRVGCNALTSIVSPLADESIAAASGVIRSIINRNPLTWFQDFEYLIGAGWRHVYNNIGSTYVLPCFVALRKKALLDVGGFGHETLSEDVDLGLALHKRGWRMTMTKAEIYTRVPQTLSSLGKQRKRWGRGILQVIRKHPDVPLNPRFGAVGVYGIPTQLYWFVHGLVVIPLTAFQVVDGYFRYFVANDTLFNFSVVGYIVGWFSAFGVLNYAYHVVVGAWPFSWFFLLVMAVFIFGTLYNLFALVTFDRIRLRHLAVMFFFFPYSIYCLVQYILPLFSEMRAPSAVARSFVNKWEKAY